MREWIISALFALSVNVQPPDGGATLRHRACINGVAVVAVDDGRTTSPVSVAEATTLAELEAMRREVPVLSPSEVVRVEGAPELVITQHVMSFKPDEVFFVIRAELRESGHDASGAPAQVVVWQGRAITGLTSFGSAKDILNNRVAQAAAAALMECRKP